MARRLLPLALLLLTAPVAFAQMAPDATVATVNGDEIKAADYYHRLEWFRPDPQSAFANLPAGFQVLRQMISERIIFGMAKTKGIAPTAPQIDARLAALTAENPNLKAQLAEAGTTEADLRAQVTNQEAQFNLVTSGVTITDLEVENFYKGNTIEFEVPKQYKLRVIAVNDDPTQKAVDDALKAGKGFADVAKQYSMDARTKDEGGAYGTVPETSLAPSTLKAVDAVAPGAPPAWVVAPSGANAIPGATTRVKFLVEAVTQRRNTPLDAPLKTRIRRRLMLQRGAVKNSVGKDLEAATQAAKVTIADPKFQQTYAALLDRAKAAQG